MLILRLAIFPLFVWALVHVIRHWKPGDKRVLLAAAGGLAVAACAAGSVMFGLTGQPDAAAFTQIIVKLTGALLLGSILSVVIYCGILLGDIQGGYWIKAPAARNPFQAFLVCALAVAGLAALVIALARYLSVPLAVGAVFPLRLFAATSLAQLAYAIAEEAFHRGCGQALLVLVLGKIRFREAIAVTLMAVVFMAQHLDPNFQAFKNLTAFSGGIVFGLIFRRYGLAPAAAVHFASSLAGTFLLPRLFH